MCAEWKAGYDVRLLASRLEKAKRVNKSTGRVSFDGFESPDVVTVLHSTVRFAEKLPELEQRNIIWHSAFAVAQAERITKESLITEISKRERACTIRPVTPYVLATTLSVRRRLFTSRPPELPARTEISGHRITFDAHLPKHFREGHREAQERGRNVIFGELPREQPHWERYSAVRVSARTRSTEQAAESALDALDLLRGIWNLYFNRRVPWRSSYGKRNPINEIVLGPIHSLHKPSGKLATERYWWSAEYAGPRKPIRLAPELERLRSFERLIRRYLAKSSYREDIETSIRRYNRALDSPHWNTAFVQLWGLLEHLTDTTRMTYENTIRRAAFLYRKDERYYNRQILKHLMHYRNRVVHAGYETDEIELHLYQLKRFVERLLLFHIFATPSFSRREDTAQFMHLPADLPELQRQMRLMRRALRYHGGA